MWAKILEGDDEAQEAGAKRRRRLKEEEAP